MTLEPIKSDHTGSWHREKFAEFTYLKSLVGEPSPHMTVAGWMSQECEPAEFVWRAGCYAAPYSVMTSEAIWNEWPWERVALYPEDLVEWVHDNWSGFHVRTERRMVRTPKAMAECLLSYRRWMIEDMWRLPGYGDNPITPDCYDRWWNSVMGLKGYRGVHNFGRYITIRLLEFFNRYLDIPLELQDIRSIGGDSPVRCLAMLYPDYAMPLLEEVSGAAEIVADRHLLPYVRERAPSTNHYVMAAMLCEYRVAYEKRHQYPGRTLDQELEYQSKPQAMWWVDRGQRTRLWEARKALFANEALGELHGWSGIRKDCERWLRDLGKNWSDVLYDYGRGGAPRAGVAG